LRKKVLNYRWLRVRGLFRYAFRQKSIRTSLGFFLAFIALYWLISISPFELWQQKDKFRKLQTEIQFIEELSGDTILLSKIIAASKSNSQYIKIIANDFLDYQIYDTNDYSLEYWTKSSYYLSPYTLGNIQCITYREIDQDKFLLYKLFFEGKCIVFWYDLNGFIEQELNNSIRFFHAKDERNEYLIIGYKQLKSKDFVDKSGNFLFSIKRAVHANDLWIIIGLLSIFIAVFFYIRALYYLVKPITQVFPILGCVFFSGLIYSTRKLLLFYKSPSIFYTLKLFNPSLYSTDVTPSLGDLLLFVFSTQIVLYYLQEHLVLNLKRWENTVVAFIVHTMALIFLLGESFSINKIFERMVVESSIWFNFDYFPRLTVYSFIGLGIMLMSFSNYYLLSNLILRTIYCLKLDDRKTLISFSIFFLVVISLVVFTNFHVEVKLTFVLLLFFIALFYIRYYLSIRSRVYSFTVFLVFASFTTTFLLSRYNVKKEEAILSSIATNITFGLDKELEHKIIEGLSKNSIDSLKSYLMTCNNIEYQEIDELEYQKYLDATVIKSAELLLSNERSKLFLLFSNSIGQYLIQQKTNHGYVYLVVYPRTHLSDITSSTKKAINNAIIRDNKISHALYLADTLHEQMGPYTYQRNYPLDSHTLKFTDELFGLDFDHYVFNFSDSIKVLVTMQKANPVSILTQFSYIFCINFFLSIFLFFIVWALRITYVSKPLFNFNELRSKIVLAIFLLIIAIFAGISLLSFNSLKSRFINYNKEVAYNNLKITQQAIEQIYNSGILNPAKDFDFYFKKLRGISLLQYDLYDQDGRLIQSSSIKTGNLIYPKVLDPQVYFQLKLNHSTGSFKSSDLNVSNSENYTVIKGNSDSQYYFLRLSNMSDEGSQNEEMRLIVVLVNLYVLFFLISMFFAIWLANRITKPLQTLTEKISNLDLSRKNEYLEYQYQDEIGELVRRYNIMVDEIQESARLLAEKEREEAWSEMAKQIAHEIKNPLTPMKLKIQFLQKKMKEGAANIDLIISSTAETLIEQINNLDNIATSFSSFGKLHTPSIEALDWKLLIQSTTNVFQSKDCSINFASILPDAIVECDRNQMISCLNNLVKNATQAYEDGKATVDITLTENSRYYILAISDYGKGISSDEWDKIFVPNFTTKSSGSGLGLAITKKIVNAMNGHIWFRSEFGKGTSFFISLPKLNSTPVFDLSEVEANWETQNFIRLDTQNFVIDLEYSRSYNVFKTVIYQDFKNAYLSEIAYYKLLKASEFLLEENKNYRLLVKDALRPFQAQELMWNIYKGEDRAKYIASPDKDSLHNYGMAVDVLIVELFDDPYTPNRVLDFGCDFDEFSERAYWDYSELNAQQMANRTLLRAVMQRAGFIPYAYEFWHFEAMHKDWVRENCIRV